MINEKKIQETIFLNNQFYKQNAEEFSKTRQTPWRGWRQLIPVITDNLKSHSVSVADLGCGNGRFYKYLSLNIIKPLQYIGYDVNDTLLVEALLRYEHVNFLKKDIINDLDTISDQYDLVVAFGITHHIPGSEFREEWFEKISKIVKENGLLVFTNWQLNTDDRISKAERADDMEENDYYYGWGDSDEQRYVHIFSDSEMRKIEKVLNKNGLTLIKTFENDGKSGNLNKYFVYKKS